MISGRPLASCGCTGATMRRGRSRLTVARIDQTLLVRENDHRPDGQSVSGQLLKVVGDGRTVDARHDVGAGSRVKTVLKGVPHDALRPAHEVRGDRRVRSHQVDDECGVRAPPRRHLQDAGEHPRVGDVNSTRSLVPSPHARWSPCSSSRSDRWRSRVRAGVFQCVNVGNNRVDPRHRAPGSPGWRSRTPQRGRRSLAPVPMVRSVRSLRPSPSIETSSAFPGRDREWRSWSAGSWVCGGVAAACGNCRGGPRPFHAVRGRGRSARPPPHACRSSRRSRGRRSRDGPAGSRASSRSNWTCCRVARSTSRAGSGHRIRRARSAAERRGQRQHQHRHDVRVGRTTSADKRS